MIPTNAKIEILKSGKPNVWGETPIVETIQIDGNLRSETKVVTNTLGDEMISNYTILFVGFVDVTTKDKIRFTEPNDEVIEKAPINVKFMRDLDGSVGFTKAVL